MRYQELLEYLPVAAVVVGVILLLVAQRDKVLPFIAKFRLKPKPTRSPGMSPVERFNTFYALRSWCYNQNHDKAVESLDSYVLPMLVLSEGDVELEP